MVCSWQRTLGVFITGLALMNISHAQDAPSSPPRLVSLGGNVTEIIYALDADGSLVGTDQSSLYPDEAQALPSVGYYRRLPVEGVASLRPTLVIASENAGPPQVLKQLRELDIKVVMVPDQATIASLKNRVTDIATLTHRSAKAEALLNSFEKSLAHAKKIPLKSMSAMTVMVRGGKAMGAGGGTAADEVLRQAGLTNVLASQSSYPILSAEVVTALAPEAIIVTQSSVDAMGGLAALKNSPILKHTPAVANDRVVVLDDLLAQGFGLRLPLAIKTIKEGLNHHAVKGQHASHH